MPCTKHGENCKGHGNYNSTKKSLRGMQSRNEVISILGHKCEKCGNIDPRVLQVDHKFGDGNAQRKELGGYYGMFKFYADNPKTAEELLRVLCANCNWIERYNSDGIMKEGILG